MSSSTSSWGVKAQLGDDIRRIRLPTTVAGASAILGETFAADPASIQIFWLDEDGDMITIKTNDDIEEAIRSGASRLHLKTGGSAAAVAAAPAPTPSSTAYSVPASQTSVNVAALAAAKAQKEEAQLRLKVQKETQAAARAQARAAKKAMQEKRSLEQKAMQKARADAQKARADARKAAIQGKHQEAAAAWSPAAVHHGVVCDISGQSPIVGTRYQMRGYDYDLCEAEFNKLSASDKLCYVAIATRGARPVDYTPATAPAPAAPAPAPAAPTPAALAVHHHVICDKSGMNPIKGNRYHLAGVNYDLCEDEFSKLAEEEKVKFVVIANRGDRPVPYGGKQEPAAAATAEAVAEAAETADQAAAKVGVDKFLAGLFGADAAAKIKVAFEDVNAQVAAKFAEHQAAAAARPGHGDSAAASGGCPMRGAGPRSGGGGCPMRGFGGSGPRAQRHQEVVAIGERLPAGPLGFRSFGPGVAQLQIALIQAGVLDQSAVRMYIGKYGPRTAQAVHSLQEKYNLGGEPGVFDESVAAVVVGKLDGTIEEPEPVAAPEPTPSAPEPETVYPVLAEEPQAQPSAPAAPASKWQSELEVLAGMGFTDETALTPLLEKHNGSIIFVMTEILG